ncbi:hypothetical protein [Microbacterium sp. 5K110]|jgi:hypothetical protein|uniref:hypothetical protein n=1 Tax=Microbacterium sp. 5K110 TaxID=2578104 RepID=UPI0010FE0A48|nr:hypothetical protein [Microbacterium sp. 5K110]TLF33258.1 hypothetical protein FE256_03965 [Microbacterium sp. 5K110]
MTPFEVNALFTEAGRLDVRMRRNNPEERADMATSWARLLADVPVKAAAWALDQHYQHSRDPIMPADIIALAEQFAPPVSVSYAGNVTEQRLAAERRAVTS